MIRRVSERRRKLEAEAGPWREQFKATVGRCEYCFKPKAPEYLDCDEIARGATRSISLTAEYAILVVCRPCHRMVQPWSRAKRLALLYIARPSSFDLEKWYELTQRRWPDWEEISRWVDVLTMLRSDETDKMTGAGVEAPASLNTLSCKGAKHV